MPIQITTTEVFGSVRQRPLLRGASARLRRVREHMRDFDRAVGQFQRKLDAVRLAALQFDRDASILKKPVQEMADAREDIEVITGEVIQNLRSALDYLIYELSYLDCGQLNDGTQFPIYKSPNDFALQRNRHMKGLDDEHVAPLQKLQPYLGCDWTALLRDLSNKDKHRRLHWIDGVIELDIPGLTTDGEADTHSRQFFEALELKANVNVDFDPPFFVAFEDGRRVKETLDVLESQVSRTLDLFRPCFDGQCRHLTPSEWVRQMDSLPLVRPDA